MGVKCYRMEEFGSDVWEEHYRQNRPFVLKLEEGALPCLDWTLDTLSGLAGDGEYVLYESGEEISAARSDMIIRKMTMQEIVGIISGCDDSNRYQTVTDIKAIPALYEQAPLTRKYFPRLDDKILQCNMWLNRGKFVSGFHYDCLENLNLQASGTKHFVLYEPGIANFYARGLFTAKGHTSEITDPDDYDRERFRDFEQIRYKRHDVVLHAGEVLYLPLCWWHNVVSSGEMNLNLNFWWINTTKSLTRFPRQFLSGIITVIYRKMTNTLY